MQGRIQYRLVVLVLAFCGLRWSEMAGLKAERVDLLKRRLNIAGAVTEVDGAHLVWGRAENSRGALRATSPLPGR